MGKCVDHVMLRICFDIMIVQTYTNDPQRLSACANIGNQALSPPSLGPGNCYLLPHVAVIGRKRTLFWNAIIEINVIKNININILSVSTQQL